MRVPMTRPASSRRTPLSSTYVKATLYPRLPASRSPPNAPPSASHLGSDACQQLAGGKGLGNVVIRPQLEAQHTVGFFSTGSDHDNGNVEPGSQASTHLHTIQTRQHQVEQHDIEGFTHGKRHGIQAVGHEGHM